MLPLYARLTNEQQQAIFSSRPRRKIVVATNVAESSLTVPGIDRLMKFAAAARCGLANCLPYVPPILWSSPITSF